MKKCCKLTAQKPEFYVVIPARYASTRLPGKPLLDIGGKPMVAWVVERAKLSRAKQVIVATDDVRIVEALSQYQHQAVMTGNHLSGTDRVAEVAMVCAWRDEAIVVNVQGDEPLIEASLIDEVVEVLNNHPEAVMATACHPIKTKADFLNPNVVKVVLDAHHHALYFSRAPIPYPRDAFSEGKEMPQSMNIYRHIGIYAYRAGFLQSYPSLQASMIEQVESLEQLRVLFHGHKIAVSISKNSPATGVDTQEDLDNVRAMLS